MRKIPEILFGRILVFLWSFGALVLELRASQHASGTEGGLDAVEVDIPGLCRSCPKGRHADMVGSTYLGLKMILAMLTFLILRAFGVALVLPQAKQRCYMLRRPVAGRRRPSNLKSHP